MSTITPTTYPTIRTTPGETTRERNERNAEAMEGMTRFTKSRDKYGRTVRRVEGWQGGKRITVGVVIVLPKVARESHGGMYMVNTFNQEQYHQPGTLTYTNNLREALASLGCGHVEGQLYISR